MKKNAILVNTCRGGGGGRRCALPAMKAGHLFGAGLDVLGRRAAAGRTIRSSRCERVATPHVAGNTFETQERSALWGGAAGRRLPAGKPPKAENRVA